MRRKRSTHDELMTLDLRLPTAWNPSDKAKHITVDNQCLALKYAGPGKTEAHAASVRTNFPMRPQTGLFYYEVKILSKGDDGFIGIGFCTKDNDLERLPGWDVGSFGYHGDDGHGFAGSGVGRSYGPSYTTGDIIGCGVNFAEASAFYTKNGTMVGTAFTSIDLTKIYYPVVGLRTPGEHVIANFGDEDFVFDISLYIKTARSLLQSDRTPDHPDLDKACTDTKQRQEIRHAVMEGHIDQVIRLTDQYYPGTLQQQGNSLILFELQCGKFVELMREYSTRQKQRRPSATSEADDGHLSPLPNQRRTSWASVAASSSSSIHSDGSISPPIIPSPETPLEDDELLKSAMKLGQCLQEEYRLDKRPYIKERLTEIFSLLAYPDIENSPSAPLLDLSRRDLLATKLNSAILELQSKPASSALEKDYQQVVAVNKQLMSNKKTHINCGSSARMTGNVDQMRRQGRWNSTMINGAYLTSLPRQLVRSMAGFPTYGRFFYIARAALNPPTSLCKKLFPAIGE
ncbi:hypothetical protein [Absidia glauca]|uniref:B30.2/SPRY domain-containing protein n=1 Tax=Absidia glauca TaxID=4829 RepID=A0A163JVY3_ABSGL|nr:hypothetical protein [Absidia glauca]